MMTVEEEGGEVPHPKLEERNNLTRFQIRCDVRYLLETEKVLVTIILHHENEVRFDYVPSLLVIVVLPRII
eukprot:scaffold9020_cov58-Skeletonema_marinoi.AAC.1